MLFNPHTSPHQAAAAEAEDYETAASLDDRMREVSERSATLGALAHQEEQRAEGLAERQRELAEQQGKVRKGYRREGGG